MKDYFFAQMAELYLQLKSSERLDVYLSGELSNFCRFNKSRVRQVGTVNQAFAELHLIRGKKHCFMKLGLSSDLQTDREALRSCLLKLRSLNEVIPDDPYLLLSESVESIDIVEANKLPDTSDMIDSICGQSSDIDLVGILAAGGVFRGFSSSAGIEHWFETYNFQFDWSLYHQADKAVKLGYAGSSWEQKEFSDKLSSGRHQLSILKRPSHSINPGEYRVYMAPAAVNEIIGLLNWNGFSEQAIRRKTSCFHKMKDESKELSSKVSFVERFKDSSSPMFDRTGIVRPEQVALIDNGKYVQGLVSARTSKEYGIKQTGADSVESALALEMSPGNIDISGILDQLETGLYINNLWYLNYSDLNQCRITGMTRFASFWVEKGEIVAPTNVMRFDDSCYSFLGHNLCGLTSQRELFLSSSTYDERSTDSSFLPGALIDGFQFTL